MILLPSSVTLTPISPVDELSRGSTAGEAALIDTNAATATNIAAPVRARRRETTLLSALDLCFDIRRSA
jgi:hypothetical protein